MKNSLAQLIASFKTEKITEERKKDFLPLIEYINKKRAKNEYIHLNFICTHNSRRSQLSQLWAAVLGHYHQLALSTYSGGVEITACNERVITALRTQGFTVNQTGAAKNPLYSISWGEVSFGAYFSKLYNDSSSPTKDFAAVMTCAHADENCPFIAGAEERIPLRYEDPKRFDDTENEEEAYLNKSIEIATELHYIFSNLE